MFWLCVAGSKAWSCHGDYWIEKPTPRASAVAAREEGASLLLWKHDVNTPGLEDLLAHSHVPLHHAVLVELVSGVCTGTEMILWYLRTPPCRTPSNNPAEAPPGLCWQRWPPGPRQVMS